MCACACGRVWASTIFGGGFCLPAHNFLLLTVRVCVRVAAGSGRVARLCCAGYCRVGCCFVTESLEAVLLYKVDGKGVVVDSETGWRCGGVAETDDPGPLFVGGYPLWLITPGVWFAGFDAAGNRVGVAGSRLDAARLVWEQWRLEKGLGL